MYSVILNDVVFPIAPEKIKTKFNGKNKTYTLINEGEINLTKEQGLSDIDITLEIPFVAGDFRQQGEFRNSQFYIDALSQMKRPFKKDGSRNCFNLTVLRENESSKITVSDMKMDVTLEDYVIDEDVKHGQAIMVELKLKQYRLYQANTVVVDNMNNTISATTNNRASKEIPENYAIKNGDTLCIIAQRELGDSNKWKDLYNLNKSLIEFAAKTNGKPDSKNGSWVFPGTVIKLR